MDKKGNQKGDGMMKSIKANCLLTETAEASNTTSSLHSLLFGCLFSGMLER
jgi:hypothetical protein